MVRLAARKRWLGRTEADEVDHEDRPADIREDRTADTRPVDRGRESTSDRDTYTHSAKIDEATEKAADAIRDAAARAASDRAHARARTSALAITDVLPGLDTDTNQIERFNDSLPSWLS